MSVNIVITMAGRGSRFRDAGYSVPKYEILAHGKSLFDWSMLSLKNFFGPDARVIFVSLKENFSSNYIGNRCCQLGLSDVRFVELEKITDGQATSAYESRDCWKRDAPLLIYNIDTYVVPSALNPEKIRTGSDGWIPCFHAPGEHWSFVELGKDDWAVDFAEKKRISNLATVGLYWFACAEYYKQAYDRFYGDRCNIFKGERYIAPLYKQLLKDGKRISVSEIPLDSVHALGTPGELDEFLALDEKMITALSSFGSHED